MKEDFFLQPAHPLVTCLPPIAQYNVGFFFLFFFFFSVIYLFESGLFQNQLKCYLYQEAVPLFPGPLTF